jgi:hypothetical protein
MISADACIRGGAWEGGLFASYYFGGVESLSVVDEGGCLAALGGCGAKGFLSP